MTNPFFQTYEETLAEARKRSPIGQLATAVVNHEPDAAHPQLTFVRNDIVTLCSMLGIDKEAHLKLIAALRESIDGGDWRTAQVQVERLELMFDGLWEAIRARRVAK